MKVHLIGIGGTGMGAVAGLLAAAGHDVRGSDVAVYPPMSEQLAALGVPVMQPYAANNLDWQPDVVVVGNVNSRDQIEVAEATKRGIRLTSFPAILGEALLDHRHSIVISGTHGKTTTTSLVAHVLAEAGRDPSLFVGGVPIGLGQGYRLGKGEDFVLEGDEYDTAFFDKGSKFLHYRPRSVVLTSIELDHVDIFPSFEAVRDAFRKFVALIPADGLLVVNGQNADAVAVAAGATCKVETYAVVDEVSANGDGADARPNGATWWASNLEYLKSGRVAFDVYRGSERLERFETLLVGRHNVANCVAAIAIAYARGVQVPIIRRGVSSFAGVRRRQELRGVAGGVTVIDDYGHHPTAVSETLRALRRRFGSRRIIAVYDPRSATSRRRTFQHEFVDAFAHADEVVIGKLFDPTKIPEAERFDPAQLALDLHRGGTKATYIPEVDAIVEYLVGAAGPGDVVIALSSGSFDGFHDKLLDAIGDPMRPARRGDMQRVRELLTRVEMPVEEGGDAAAPSFFVLTNESGLIGCVALEVFGDDAILRSLTVDTDHRGGGYGWMLADMAMSQARYRGVRRVYLLTESASDFFAAKFGFRVVDRSTVSAQVGASTTFQHSTDGRYVSMRLDL